MKAFKKTIAMIVLSALLMTGFAFAIPTTVSAAYDNTYTFTISGTNAALPGYDHSNVYLFPNTGSSAKTISYKSYNFRYSKLMIFNASGRVVECGGNLYDGSSSVTGAPQVSVTIPAGGFMVAFGANNTNFMKIYNVVMEGAMLYNATMSVIYEAYASYSGSTLTVKYNNPKPASANAISFLFVGNSTTYFNGTPIKFKAMAAAAGIEIDVVYCTYGSAFLSEFADPNHERGKAFRNHLNSRKFDYVVLQDAAGRDYNTTKPQVAKLLPLIEANGAEALLYMRYSAASTVDQIRTNAIKHHTNYATLAKDYNLVCAPAADAFVHYAEKYNDPYTLYASDGGHHSKEGSYLIAATWLYSYLGVDPVGNTYTADMSSSMVRKLQECAKIACEEGYPYPGMDNDFQEGGVYYKNIAKDKKYTVTGDPYTRDDGQWMDTNTSGNILYKLTDGFIAADGSDSANVCWKGNTVEVTIDLESIYAIKNIRLDLHGNTSWGITDPSTTTVKVAASMDGKTFNEIGTATMGTESTNGGWMSREFTLKTGSDISAKYVKIILSNSAYARYWLSEIRVYGGEFKSVAKATLSETLNATASLRHYPYSAAQIKAIHTAYNNALSVLNNTDSTEESFINATNALNNAIKYTDGILSIGKSYTVSTNPRSDKWKDDGKRLTDGSRSTPSGESEAYAGLGTNPVEIVVDLGANAGNYNNFGVYAAANADWGISAPSEITVSVSDDGSDFTEIASGTTVNALAQNDGWVTYYVNARASANINKRYVKFIIFPGDGNHIWLDEVVVANSDPVITGGVYVNGINKYISAGDCHIFTSSPVSVESGNISYTRNVVAKWDGATSSYIVKSVSAGNGASTPSITLASDEILIAAHSWENPVDSNLVYGSAYNYDLLSTVQVGDKIYLNGIDLANKEVAPAAYVSVPVKVVEEPEDETAINDNLAKDKSYTTTGIYSDANGVVYPDENGKSLTNGKNAPSDAKYNDPAFVGFNKNNADYAKDGYATITVDLGAVYSVDKFVAQVASSFNSSVGISAPASLSVYVSTDNKTFVEAGSIVPTDDSSVAVIAATVALDKSVEARYVQFRFVATASWIFVSEVEVYESENATDDYIVGDVNDDKKVDSVDYLLVKRACFKTYELDADEFVRADVNSDSKMDSTDYLLIKRIAFGTYKA